MNTKQKEIVALTHQCFTTLNDKEMLDLFYVLSSHCQLEALTEKPHLADTPLSQVIEAVQENCLNTTQLLEIYSSIWLEREGEFCLLVNSQKHRLFIEKLAVYMFLHNKQLGIDNKELIAIYTTTFSDGKKLDNVELQNKLHSDLQSCAFLQYKRDHFRFKHRFGYHAQAKIEVK